jgi:predicted DNA-binding transcriptional regulator AlpA
VSPRKKLQTASVLRDIRHDDGLLINAAQTRALLGLTNMQMWRLGKRSEVAFPKPLAGLSSSNSSWYLREEILGWAAALKTKRLDRNAKSKRKAPAKTRGVRA